MPAKRAIAAEAFLFIGFEPDNLKDQILAPCESRPRMKFGFAVVKWPREQIGDLSAEPTVAAFDRERASPL